MLRRFARRLRRRPPAGGEVAAPQIVENDTRKPLAVVTFVWNEEPFLKKWLDYYGAQVGRENLYIFAHGEEPMVYAHAEGCRIYGLPRSRIDHNFARNKSHFGSAAVSFLLAEYKTVIVGDIDELVVIDPVHGSGLLEFVEQNRGRNRSLKAFNLNILDAPDKGPLDFDQPILAQRTLAQTLSHFCKPVICSERVAFGPGFHFSTHYPDIAEGAYLVHLHFADRATNETIAETRKATFEDNPHLAGVQNRQVLFWSKHMRRYRERMKKVGDLPIHDLDDIVPRYISAMRQAVVRRPGDGVVGKGYTMTFGAMSDDVRIRIPDRFASVC